MVKLIYDMKKSHEEALKLTEILDKDPETWYAFYQTIEDTLEEYSKKDDDAGPSVNTKVILNTYKSAIEAFILIIQMFLFMAAPLAVP